MSVLWFDAKLISCTDVWQEQTIHHSAAFVQKLSVANGQDLLIDSCKADLCASAAKNSHITNVCTCKMNPQWTVLSWEVKLQQQVHKDQNIKYRTYTMKNDRKNLPAPQLRLIFFVTAN